MSNYDHSILNYRSSTNLKSIIIVTHYGTELGLVDIYDVIGMTIHTNGGVIEGRTAIQKLIYFETLKIPSLSPCIYHHHFYGPFSRDVASSLEDFTAFSYVNEIAHSGFYNSYTYEMTEKGNRYALKKKEQFPKEYEIISNLVKTCTEFCDLKSAPLSYAAKSYYILINTEEGRKDKFTKEDIRKVGKNFDWNISQDDVEIGVSLLQKLHLVELS